VLTYTDAGSFGDATGIVVVVVVVDVVVGGFEVSLVGLSAVVDD
jgi:hypothetical protein